MQRFFATVFLIVLIIGFFIFYHYQKNNFISVKFSNIITPAKSKEDKIVYNEFLLLMDQGDEKYLSEVLKQYNLELIMPLGEWIFVRRPSAKEGLIVSVNSPEGHENREFLASIEAHHAVHSGALNFVQPDLQASCVRDDKAFKALIPNDRYFSYQWHLSTNKGVDMPGAWAITTGSPRNVIAVVDRNFDVNALDWACDSRLYYYQDIFAYLKSSVAQESPLNHGSLILDVLAPCTDDEKGFAGIDWHAQIMAVDSKRDSSFSARMFGILWAAGLDVGRMDSFDCKVCNFIPKNKLQANIVNASFGFAASSINDMPYGPMLDAVGAINRQGLMLVASSGNDGMLADFRLPGAASGVISVGASTKEKKSANFSNFGLSVDVLAPGEEILALRKSEPESLNGTSFSAPIVSGIASLMKARNPSLSWKEVEYILKATSDKMTCEDYCPTSMESKNRLLCEAYCCKGDQILCASGIVNAKKAVLMADKNLNTVLVDVDDYYLPLSEDNGYQTTLKIKNYGDKDALVRIVSSDRNLLVEKNILNVQARSTKITKDIGIKYLKKPQGRTLSYLLIEAARMDNPTVFIDSIEAVVEAVPDA